MLAAASVVRHHGRQFTNRNPPNPFYSRLNTRTFHSSRSLHCKLTHDKNTATSIRHSSLMDRRRNLGNYSSMDIFIISNPDPRKHLRHISNNWLNERRGMSVMGIVEIAGRLSVDGRLFSFCTCGPEGLGLDFRGKSLDWTICAGMSSVWYYNIRKVLDLRCLSTRHLRSTGKENIVIVGDDATSHGSVCGFHMVLSRRSVDHIISREMHYFFPSKYIDCWINS